MFTGIIEGLGTIEAMRPAQGGMRMRVRAAFDLEGTKIGDSIAVNGACLTAIAINGRRFEADLSPETIARTTFGRVGIGSPVNLERAMRLSDRLDGHLVSGHIDGMGRIHSRQATGNAVIITFSIPPELSRYMIPKGSVAVDGISLTINHLNHDSFNVSVIPHTAAITTIGLKAMNAPVNIETDVIGKYIERLMGSDPRSMSTGVNAPRMDREFLIKNGFI